MLSARALSKRESVEKRPRHERHTSLFKHVFKSNAGLAINHRPTRQSSSDHSKNFRFTSDDSMDGNKFDRPQSGVIRTWN